MKEQRCPAEAVAAEGQPAGLAFPHREGKRAKAARHAGIAPALDRAPQQNRVRRRPDFGRRQPKLVSEFLAIVEADERGERRRPISGRRRLRRAVRRWRRRSPLNDQRLPSAAGDISFVARAGHRAQDGVFDLRIERVAAQGHDPGKRAHRQPAAGGRPGARQQRSRIAE